MPLETVSSSTATCPNVGEPLGSGTSRDHIDGARHECCEQYHSRFRAQEVVGAHIAFMRAADTARCGPPLGNRRARQVPVNSLSQSSARILHGLTSRVRPRLLRAPDARGRSVSRQGVPHQHLAVGYALRPIHDSSSVVYGSCCAWPRSLLYSN
jgi:hypothetical protein